MGALQNEITRLQNAKAAIRSAIIAKGIQVPSNAKLDDYDLYVAQIQGNPYKFTGTTKSSAPFTIYINSNTYNTTIDGSAGDNLYKWSYTHNTAITSVSCYADTNLVSIVIPSCVTSLGNSAFLRCSSLVSVSLPDGLTSISSNDFQYCSSLTNISIPSSVTIIGNSVFDGCSSLTNISIPAGVSALVSAVFRNCSSLTSLTCNATTPMQLYPNALTGCSSLAHIYVPAESVSAYQSASGWSQYASIISAIPSN